MIIALTIVIVVSAKGRTLSDLIKAMLIGWGPPLPNELTDSPASFLKHSLVVGEAEWRGFGYPCAHKGGSSGQRQLIWVMLH